MIPAPDAFRCTATMQGHRCFKVSHLGVGPHHYEEPRNDLTYDATSVLTWVDPQHPWPESEFPLESYIDTPAIEPVKVPT